MKQILVFSILLICTLQLRAQTEAGTLYHPEADAKVDIQEKLDRAKKEGKHLVLQVGGNWCGWCYKFHDFVAQDSLLKDYVNENFVFYHLNYSKENKNEDLLMKYRFPQRLGFPVFVILDGEGQYLHTQDSALLESGKGYDRKKVENFFKAWTVQALDPKSYEKK